MPLYGVDISSNNEPVDISLLSAAKEFVIIKATGDEEGRLSNQYINPFWRKRYRQAYDEGMLVGLYHYAHPFNQPDPIASAEFFLQEIAPVVTDGTIIALDMEEPAQEQRPFTDLSYWTSVWLRRIIQELKCRPVIYSNQWFLEAHGLAISEIASLADLWLASWGDSYSNVPPWSSVRIWQYSENETGVPGIAPKPALVDRFLGEIADWLRMGVHGNDPAPPPPVDPVLAKYDKEYWTPLFNLMDRLVTEPEFAHANRALHALVTNAATLHKVACGSEPSN